jgi:hypothetical protein
MKEAIIRNVQDIDDADRRVLEHVLGQKLRKNQQVIIRIISLGPEAATTEGNSAESQTAASLPEWCNVYDGLTDGQVADLEAAVLQRANLTRP